MACKGGVWLAMYATVPCALASCGYVGQSDGWTDLHHNFQMDYKFDHADNGNVALAGQIDLSQTRELTLPQLSAQRTSSGHESDAVTGHCL